MSRPRRRARSRTTTSTRAPRFARIRRLPLGRIGLGTLAAFGIVLAVPPLRQGAFALASESIFLATSPFAPNVSDFSAMPQGTKVLAADGSVLAELDGTQHLQPVRLDQISPAAKHAVLAAEDANFYDHPGVDAGALVRAAFNNVQGNSEQGGSTITQQLAKINYTNRQRTVFRKAKEVLYAAQLERKFSKNELLQRYVNQVYFGEGAYGMAAAAKEFFGTTPDKLDAAQAAMLAGKIRSPEGLNPRIKPDEVKTRRDQVLRNMHKHGWLSKQDLDAALAEPVALTPPQPAPGVKAPHFVEFVKREAGSIDALGGSPDSRGTQLFTGGYTVETTLDPKAFDAATATVQKQLGQKDDPTAAVVSVQPGDGAIRNLFGGLDFDGHQFDPATQGRRQPGSSFKPFVYMAAIRDGLDPRTKFDSASPMTIPCGTQQVTVNNYEGESEGMVDMDTALAKSINTVYMQVNCKVGADKTVQAAKDAGITEDLDPLPSIALGGLTHGVSPLEMAAAYATFAAKGTYARPYAIARIRDRNGRVIYEHERQLRQAFDAKQAGVLTAALEGVVQKGTGEAAAIGRPVAGKTGTTEQYGDAWFVGYVPQLSTAVWVGYPDNRTEMRKVHGGPVAGGRFPAQIFSGTMTAALQGVPVQDLFTATPDQLNLHGLKPSDLPVPVSAPPRPPAPSTTVTTGATSSTVPSGVDGSTTTTWDTTQQTTQTTVPNQKQPTTTTTAPKKQATTTSSTTSTSAPTASASGSGGGSASGGGGSGDTTTTQPAA